TRRAPGAMRVTATNATGQVVMQLRSHLRGEVGVQTLGGRQDEGGHDGDHDGREQGAEQDRRITGGDTHDSLQGSVVWCVVARVRSYCASSHLASHPAAYRPRPNTVCVSRLWTLVANGWGVRLPAMPAPMPGCIRRNGIATVPMPTASAGPGEGCRAQSSPQMPSRSAANAVPTR